MTVQEILDAVDARLANVWSAIEARQASYAAAHDGRAWQGLRTHDVLPADGVESLPDVGTDTPTDQSARWPTAIRTATLPMALQVDAYESPDGPGYQVTLFVQIAGEAWTRTVNVGPQSERERAWESAGAEAL